MHYLILFVKERNVNFLLHVKSMEQRKIVQHKDNKYVYFIDHWCQIAIYIFFRNKTIKICEQCPRTMPTIRFNMYDAQICRWKIKVMEVWISLTPEALQTNERWGCDLRLTRRRGIQDFKKEPGVHIPKADEQAPEVWRKYLNSRCDFPTSGKLFSMSSEGGGWKGMDGVFERARFGREGVNPYMDPRLLTYHENKPR